MRPSVLVITLSESFCEVWPELVPSAHAELKLVADLSADGAGEVCAVVISAAGCEDSVFGEIDRIRGALGANVAVVGASTDYRVVAALLHAGAHGYFALPQDVGALRSWIVEHVEKVATAERVQELARDHRQRYDFSKLIGQSPCLRAAIERASRVIPRGATVLIHGETGTGKELLARAIHYNGPRAAQPFVEVNCTALPENLLEAELFGYEPGAFTDARTAKPGLFESAHGGTLFLDEIGDLSLALQAKLLRVLEDQRIRRLGSVRANTVDVRIITATHVDLAAAVREGRFREDLYYRLSIVPIHLPPLRERGDDVLLLARHFLERFAREYEYPHLSLNAEMQRLLITYPWPGNIRELRNSIERMVLLGEGELRPQDLFIEAPNPVRGTAPLPFPASIREIEEAAARAMVERCGGNKTRAADILGISRKYLYELLSGGEAGDADH